jgi:uncharacterized damage-inducible protein DinB
MMPDPLDVSLLEAVLDSWDRSNAILLNLLHALPDGGLQARSMAGSPTVAQMFTHMHYVRQVFVVEDAPESSGDVSEQEWVDERDPGRIARMLIDSARSIREAVKGRLAAGKGMDQHYDHPILLLQHMIWHEGYHHGQIKLALKATGCALSDQIAGPATWSLWMDRRRGTPQLKT